MRLRAAVASAGFAVVAVGGLALPAQAAQAATAVLASSWTDVGGYVYEYLCVDAGQQYEREGWNAYQCTDLGFGTSPHFELLIR